MHYDNVFVRLDQLETLSATAIVATTAAARWSNLAVQPRLLSYDWLIDS